MRPRRVLTAAQIRDVDKKTEELGIPGIILMENAASRVVEFLAERFAPLEEERVIVFCGKGSNGGDGLAIARQLLTRFRCRSLNVLLACSPEEIKGDAEANYRMLVASGGAVQFALEPTMQAATLILDALLGTGLEGSARGKSLEWIQAINSGFAGARVVAVDVPSGMPSDTGEPSGECARADATVTFTAPRLCHVLAPNCRSVGECRVAPIGTSGAVVEGSGSKVSLIEPAVFRDLLGPRDPGGNKGSYGHVLVVAGSRGKTGAAAMCGLSVLRAGAGLVTVASSSTAMPVIAAHSPELMTEFLSETPDGWISGAALREIEQLTEKRDLIAIGPGLGTAPETAGVVRDLFQSCAKPMVVDADALNILAEGEWPGAGKALRVLTPHPGEMARLARKSIKEVQGDRIEKARQFAQERQVTVVLKGERSLLAFPDGEVWVNPTGSSSMATGGTGDVLTGMIAGMLAQFPHFEREAIAAAVWLHGRAGQIGARRIGEQPFVATDLLRMLPAAMSQARDGKPRAAYSDLI